MSNFWTVLKPFAAAAITAAIAFEGAGYAAAPVACRYAYIRPISSPRQKISIVIEGAGDVVRLKYAAAIRLLKQEYPNREIKVTFIDRSVFWKHNPELKTKMEGIKALITEIGADYLDKSEFSDTKELKKRLDQLHADVAIIATPDSTHLDVAREWIDRGVQVFVEKPFDTDLKKAKALLKTLKNRPDQVYAYDHYRAAFLPSPTQLKSMNHFLGGLKKFTFYLVEDHSGSDPSYAAPFKRNGAIESEGREQALKHGLIFDLLSHMPPLLAYFGKINSIVPKRIRAAKYTGVDQDPDREAGIDGETFADLEFTFTGLQGERVDGAAVIGKGVGGAPHLGPDFKHEASGFELIGRNGNRIVVNLRAAKEKKLPPRVIFYDSLGHETAGGFEINAQPYFTFFEEILNGRYTQDRLALPAADGVTIMSVLAEFSGPIQSRIRSGEKLPFYAGGMAGLRSAPPVEVLHSTIPVIWQAPE